MTNNVTSLLKHLSNFFLFILVFLGSGLFFYFVDPYQRGFFCQDDSIKYPYKSSIISPPVLYAISVLLPLIAMCVGEASYILNEIKGKEAEGGAIKSSRVKILGEHLFCLCVTFLFGFAVTQFTSDVMKYSVGRLRPYFMDVCKPSNYNCTGDYVQSYICTGESKTDIKQARLSFPSGHASMSMYGMVYLVFYLQQRLHIPTVWLIKPFLQILCIYISLYCGLSRLADHHHHPSDIICGFLLGLLVSVSTVVYISHFKEHKEIEVKERRPSSVKII